MELWECFSDFLWFLNDFCFFLGFQQFTIQMVLLIPNNILYFYEEYFIFYFYLSIKDLHFDSFFDFFIHFD
jgi:hypothetical protein